MTGFEKRYYEDIHRLVYIQEKILNELKKINAPVEVEMEESDIDERFTTQEYLEIIGR